MILLLNFLLFNVLIEIDQVECYKHVTVFFHNIVTDNMGLELHVYRYLFLC